MMKCRKYVVLALVGAGVVLANRPLSCQDTSKHESPGDWSYSVLSLEEQVSLLAIEDNAETIHRFQLRQEALSIDLSNKEGLIVGLREMLLSPQVTQREKDRVTRDMAVEERAIQMRHARQKLVEQQLANFEEMKSLLEDTAAAARLMRARFDGKDPEHPPNQVDIVQVFLKFTETMNHLEVFQMTTELSLIEESEAELLSSARQQERAVDVYEERFAQEGVDLGMQEYERRNLELYKRRSEQQKGVLQEFERKRRALEEALDFRRLQLTRRTAVKESPVLVPDSEEERQRLSRQLLVTKEELLNELVTKLEDERHVISTAKMRLKEIVLERTEANARMVRGPEGIIYRGEQMTPSASERISELDDEAKRMDERLILARQEAAEAMRQVGRGDQ